MPTNNRCHEDRDRSTKRRAFLGAAGIAGISGLAGCLNSLTGGGGNNAIKVGFASGLTGPYSVTATKQKEGAEFAVKELNNNGGVLDRELELYTRDTELSGETASRRVNDLIQNEGIDVLTGAMSGAVMLVLNDLAKQSNLMYMPGTSGSEPLRTENYHPGTFAAHAATFQYARANANYIKENLGDSVYWIVADYAWGNQVLNLSRDWFTNELGGQEAGVTKHPIGNSDFASQISSAQDSDADTVLLCNFGIDTANTIRQAREFGLTDEKDIFAMDISTSIAQEVGRDIWDGVYGGAQWYNKLDSEAANTFSSKMNEEYGYPGAAYAAVLYTAVHEWARGVESAGSLETDAIVTALEESPQFTHTKSQEEWRQCDHQSIQEWVILEGKAQSEQDNEWDIFDIAGTEGGTELLPTCDYVGSA